MRFNPNEYETVKSRKERFYKDHPDGRIIVEMGNPTSSMEYALFKCYVYFDKEDQEKGLPRATGYALEVRDTQLSISNEGKEYESVNYSSWTENSEESAVGRALDNAGYSGNKKPSRDEMEKAQRMNGTMKNYNQSQPHASNDLATYKQVDAVLKMTKKTGRAITLDEVNKMTKQKASELIDTMIKELG